MFHQNFSPHTLILHFTQPEYRQLLSNKPYMIIKKNGDAPGPLGDLANSGKKFTFPLFFFRLHLCFVDLYVSFFFFFFLHLFLHWIPFFSRFFFSFTFLTLNPFLFFLFPFLFLLLLLLFLRWISFSFLVFCFSFL